MSVPLHGRNETSFSCFRHLCIGQDPLNLLRQRGYKVEVYNHAKAPPKLIIDKVRSGVDGVITTLRDPIDRDVFEAERCTLKVVPRNAVGFDNIDRAVANRYRISFTNTDEVLAEATAEFVVLILGCVAWKLYRGAFGAGEPLDGVAPLPALPGRWSHRQDRRRDRNRTHQAGAHEEGSGIHAAILSPRTGPFPVPELVFRPIEPPPACR